MLQKSNVLKPGDVNEASSKSSADEVDHDKVVKSNNSHDMLNINVWQDYSIGGQVRPAENFGMAPRGIQKVG